MSRYAQGPFATIHVGKEEERRTYQIYTELLQDKSEYFRGALSNGFKESLAQEIDLPEANPAAFGVFVDWAYKGRICDDHNTETLLIDVWILADRIMCPDLQNKAIDLLKIYHSNNSLIFWSLLQVQEVGLDDSKLMQYLVDLFASAFIVTPKNFDIASTSPTFLRLKPQNFVKLMRQMQHFKDIKKSSPLWPTSITAPSYHVGTQAMHENGEIGDVVTTEEIDLASFKG